MLSRIVAATPAPPFETALLEGGPAVKIGKAPPRSLPPKPSPRDLPREAGPSPPARPPPAATLQTKGAAPRTWAQVAAGQSGQMPGTTDAIERRIEEHMEKTQEQLKCMEARMEKKTQTRMMDPEERINSEKDARVEQSAKIDAVFSFIQNSASGSPPPSPPATHSHVHKEEPAQKRRKSCRRKSDASNASEWTTVPQSHNGAAAHKSNVVALSDDERSHTGDKDTPTQKATAAKVKAKATSRKWTQRKLGCK